MIRVFLMLDDGNRELYLRIFKVLDRLRECVEIDCGFKDADIIVVDNRRLACKGEYFFFDENKWYLLITENISDVGMCLPPNIRFVLRRDAEAGLELLVKSAGIMLQIRERLSDSGSDSPPAEEKAAGFPRFTDLACAANG